MYHDIVLYSSPLSTLIDIVCSDVHCEDCLPEVEIFSLIEEQLPRYKLRSTPLPTTSLLNSLDAVVAAPFSPSSSSPLAATTAEEAVGPQDFLLSPTAGANPCSFSVAMFGNDCA